MNPIIRHSKLCVHPAGVPLAGHLTPPPSKSTSTRCVLAASLAPGESEIANVARSNNVRAMLTCCEALGADLQRRGDALDVRGVGRNGLRSHIVLNPGNSGIVLRLLLGVTAVLQDVRFVTDYAQSLGQRSNAEMLDALTQLGVHCNSSGAGRLPIAISRSRLRGRPVRISAKRSSQFLSGLLFLGGLLDEPMTIEVVDELKAKPMVRTTLRVLREAGVAVKASDDLMTYVTEPGGYQPVRHVVGADPASTAALLALAGVVESDVTFEYAEEELGDGAVFDYLQALGIRIERQGSITRVQGGGAFRACDFDGSLAPDAVLPLAALAAFANGTSRFTNIEHLRYKECDRISDFRAELSRVGVRAEEKHDELIIHGSPRGVAGGVAVDSHYDHGVIMALTVVGLRSRGGVAINEPRHVAQTYPQFFSDIQRLGATVTPAVH